MTARILALFLLVAAWPVLASAQASRPIPSAEAGAHLDKEGTFEMVVRATKDAGKHKEIYLDSEADFRDPKNLAVVIAYDHLDAFKKAKVEAPATHDRGKTIRVTGTPKKEGEQVRIRVEDPKAISVVEEKK